MKKKIAILGSTGSIGKTLLNIVYKNKKDFEVVLLSANNDYKTLIEQAKKFKVKNLILSDQKSFKKINSKNFRSKIKLFNSFNDLNKIFKKKIDYVMSSIVGIEGLEPTYKIVKFTKNIAIANKESIICGWNLINKELKKNKTKFIPVDSEHFSIWFGLNNQISVNNIDQIYLTASGGPLKNIPINMLKNIKINQAVNHPNWKMGKKISVDSATLMNKIFEVIEAKHIFNLSYKQIKILIHPMSYVHAIIKTKKGLTKIISHDTSMEIPIFNTLYQKENKFIKSNDISIKKLNNLNFEKVSKNRFPVIKIINQLTNHSSLYETVIVSANDTLVNLYLSKKIKFNEISKNLIKFLKLKEFNKYKKIQPKKIEEIMKLKNDVSLKIKKMCI